MRGILVVNPQATTTSSRVTDVLVRALSASVDLEVITTAHQGHARELGERARRERLDVVITLGGDGTVHETVNGMLADGPAPDGPILATVPGGSANVFARALGLPADPVEATGCILEAITTGRTRMVGLGTLTIGEGLPRWFVANAGLGLDAEIIGAMDTDRRFGRAATPYRYLKLTLREYFRHTDRRTPAMCVVRPESPDIDGVFLAIVQNTSPWTYLGSRALNPCPDASFDTGLDVLVLHDLHFLSVMNTVRRMVTPSGGATTRTLSLLHDQPAFGIRARRPVAVQADGEGLGLAQRVAFQSHPAALRVAV